MAKTIQPIKLKYESSTPATPPAGTGVIYFDNASQLPYFKNAAGTSGAISSPNFPLNAPAGSAAAPSIAFTGDTGTGIYSSGASNIDFSINGNHRVKISDTQLVIPLGGPTVPSLTFVGDLNTGLYNNTSDNLIIVTGGTARFGIDNTYVRSHNHFIADPDNTVDLGRAADNAFRIVYAGTAFRSNTLGGASAPAFSFNADQNTGMYSTGADVLDFSTGGVQRFSINSSQSGNKGGWKRSFSTASDDNYAIQITDDYIKVAITASRTFSIPAAATMGAGAQITLKDQSGNLSGALTLTIDPNASETIDGATTFVMSSAYESLTIVCDGSNWFIV